MLAIGDVVVRTGTTRPVGIICAVVGPVYQVGQATRPRRFRVAWAIESRSTIEEVEALWSRSYAAADLEEVKEYEYDLP